MPEIYATIAQKVLKDLGLIKAKFIIILQDGTTFDSGSDEITLTGPKKHRAIRRESKMPYGTYTKTYRHSIVAMNVGDVMCFDRTAEMVSNKVTLSDLQGAISGIACATFGNDAHKVHINTKTACVELMRTA